MTHLPEYSKLKRGISVVVCCYNSAKVIVTTIQALSKQIIPEGFGFEVILINNNCKDNTVQLAKTTWGDTPHPLYIFDENRPGLIFARATGVKQAKYDILLFVDDDNVLEENWIKKLDKIYLERPDVGAVGGDNELFVEGTKPDWLNRYKHIFACGPRSEVSGIISKKMYGAGVSFRTEIIQAIMFSDLPLFLVGRTKNKLARGEDTEMAFRMILMGWKFYYDNTLKLKHLILNSRINWQYVCNAVRGGGEANIILEIYKKLVENKKQLNQKEMLMFILKKWLDYIKKYHKTLFQRNKEGTEQSFWFNWLVGMSRGFFYYRGSYHKIQERIRDYYLENGPNCDRIDRNLRTMKSELTD